MTPHEGHAVVDQGQEDAIPRASGLAWVALLLVRGALLWIVVPVTALGWAVSFAWLWGSGITLAKALGWSDLNLIAAIQRTSLRPWFRRRQAWVPVGDIPTVEHRLSWLDPA
jgi:hypothetical protein